MLSLENEKPGKSWQTGWEIALLHFLEADGLTVLTYRDGNRLRRSTEWRNWRGHTNAKTFVNVPPASLYQGELILREKRSSPMRDFERSTAKSKRWTLGTKILETLLRVPVRAS